MPAWLTRASDAVRIGIVGLGLMCGGLMCVVAGVFFVLGCPILFVAGLVDDLVKEG